MNSNSNNDTNNHSQQPPNAYERWLTSTPPTTRFVLYTILGFYLITFLSNNVIFTFSNVLLFVLHGEIWRRK